MIAFYFNTERLLNSVAARCVENILPLITDIHNTRNLTKAALAVDKALTDHVLHNDYFVEYNADTIKFWIMARSSERVQGEPAFLTIFATNI